MAPGAGELAANYQDAVKGDLTLSPRRWGRRPAHLFEGVRRRIKSIQAIGGKETVAEQQPLRRIRRTGTETDSPNGQVNNTLSFFRTEQLVLARCATKQITNHRLMGGQQMKIRRGVKSAVICGALGTGVLSLLAGCASVTAIPLEADGLNAVPGAQPGFRYYIPRPYLLVAEMPAAKAGGTQQKSPVVGHAGPTEPGPPHVGGPTPQPQVAEAKGEPPGAGPPADATKKKDTGSTTTSTPDASGPSSGSAPATDTSFVATNGTTYIAKLIYLPDYSRPMAVELNTGIVGISKVEMTLQDGWMLTYVSANADNSKMGDVLIAAIQAVSSNLTGGATKAASTAKKPPGGAPQRSLAPYDRALRPGLYAFDYDYGMSRVSFLCAVAYFDSRGSRPADPRKDPGACGLDYSRPIPPVVAARY